MEFKKGDEIYCIIDKTSVKCIVQANSVTREVSNLTLKVDSLLVICEKYNHVIYVDRRNCFFNYFNCVKAIELYKELQNIYEEDENNMIFERNFNIMSEL